MVRPAGDGDTCRPGPTGSAARDRRGPGLQRGPWAARQVHLRDHQPVQARRADLGGGRRLDDGLCGAGAALGGQVGERNRGALVAAAQPGQAPGACAGLRIGATCRCVRDGRLGHDAGPACDRGGPQALCQPQRDVGRRDRAGLQRARELPHQAAVLAAGVLPGRDRRSVVLRRRHVHQSRAVRPVPRGHGPRLPGHLPRRDLLRPPRHPRRRLLARAVRQHARPLRPAADRLRADHVARAARPPPAPAAALGTRPRRPELLADPLPARLVLLLVVHCQRHPRLPCLGGAHRAARELPAGKRIGHDPCPGGAADHVGAERAAHAVLRAQRRDLAGPALPGPDPAGDRDLVGPRAGPDRAVLGHADVAEAELDDQDKGRGADPRPRARDGRCHGGRGTVPPDGAMA